LVDFEHFQQIAKSILEQYGQDLAVASQMAIGTADNTDFSNAKHS
jgi:hypothetical protein